MELYSMARVELHVGETQDAKTNTSHPTTENLENRSEKVLVNGDHLALA
jgi:hypothetical protein